MLDPLFPARRPSEHAPLMCGREVPPPTAHRGGGADDAASGHELTGSGKEDDFPLVEMGDNCAK